MAWCADAAISIRNDSRTCTKIPIVIQVRLHLHFGDLTDANSLRHILEAVEPDEVLQFGGTIPRTCEFRHSD